MLKVAIIGAGSAGICSAKHSLAHGLDVTIFEKSNAIGGTWIYKDEIDKDKNGFPVYSSVYKGLRSISPKEVMGFPDYPITHKDNLSYITHQDMLNYLNSYADAFNVRKHIKFQHNVVHVWPIHKAKWAILVEDLTNRSVCKHIFDGIFICNGHYNEPNTPIIDGQEIFQGKQMHSMSYRNSEYFKGEKVLVIGVGVSGIDIAYQLSKVENISVTLSYKTTFPIPKVYSENIDLRPVVSRLTETGAEFVDGSEKNFTVIIYCTGFKYSFPFLSVACGLKTENNYVQPLYKHCININHPTMAIIGLPFYICPAITFDIQVRFFLKHFCGEKHFPSKKDMIADTKCDMNKRWKKGYRMKDAHRMAYDQADYWDDLAKIANIKSIPPVINKLFIASDLESFENYNNFRSYIYKIIDENTFEQIN